MEGLFFLILACIKTGMPRHTCFFIPYANLTGFMDERTYHQPLLKTYQEFKNR